MFPASYSSLPLPVRPNVGRYRKLAKELVKACGADAAKPGSTAIRRWAETWVNAIIHLPELTFTVGTPVEIEEWVAGIAAFAKRRMIDGGRESKLADAQFVIARSHGFESWPKFIAMLQAMARRDSIDGHFEAAVDAMVAGELQTLRRLLNENPSLLHQRSMREHGATLLHYIAANGVEGYRQKTPANAMEIAGELLKARSPGECNRSLVQPRLHDIGAGRDQRSSGESRSAGSASRFISATRSLFGAVVRRWKGRLDC